MIRTSLILLSALLAHGTARADVCKPVAATTKIYATFSSTVALRDVATWVAGFTCKSVVFPAAVEQVAGKIGIVAPGELTPAQGLQLFIDAAQAAGVVVTVKPTTIVLALDPKAVRPCTEVTKVSAAPDEETNSVVNAGIKLDDAKHARITRAAVDAVLSSPMDAANGARIVPSAKGFKVYAIRPGSVFQRIGLTNGDTIVSINGLSMTTADKALEAYTTLRTANKFEISIIRSGKAMTLVLTVVTSL